MHPLPSGRKHTSLKAEKLEQLTKVTALVTGSAGFESLKVSRYKPESGGASGFAIRGEVSRLAQDQILQKLKDIEAMLKPIHIYYRSIVKTKTGFYISMDE